MSANSPDNHIKNLRVNLKYLVNAKLLVIVTIGALSARADNFPESYIRKQLQDVKYSIHVDLRKIKPGSLVGVKYLGKPVWIYRRTAAELLSLQHENMAILADPADRNYSGSVKAVYFSSVDLVWTRLLMMDSIVSEKPLRSIKNEYMVVGGWGPQSGCMMQFKILGEHKRDHAIFYDLCIDAAYDGAGRILKGKLTNVTGGRYERSNLYIPPHYYASDSEIVIGIRKSQNLPNFTTARALQYEGLNPTEKLMKAARYNDISTARKALAEGAYANYFVLGKGGPFDAAVAGGSMDMIRLLVRHGARPHYPSRKIAEMLERKEVIRLIDKLQGHVGSETE